MMEERYHVTTQNRFYPDMSNVPVNLKKKTVTVEEKLISQLRIITTVNFTVVIYKNDHRLYICVCVCVCVCVCIYIYIYIYIYPITNFLEMYAVYQYC